MSEKRTITYYYKARYFGDFTIGSQRIQYEPPAGASIRDAICAAMEISAKHGKTVQMSFNNVKLDIANEPQKSLAVQKAIDTYYAKLKQR